jgi:8-oxo-dGTP pyrophosphatase MutT (NUDIX family)
VSGASSTPPGGRPPAPLYETSVAFATPWFSVLERTPTDGSSPFFAVQPRDYCSVLAITADDQLVLVEQFRPIIERWTLELPSGTVDPGESPEAAMVRELSEETGFRPVELIPLGVLAPDTGRLANQLFCYFARVELDPDRLAPTADEWSLQPVLLTKLEFLARHLAGPCPFDSALQMAVIQMAAIQGHFDLRAP